MLLDCPACMLHSGMAGSRCSNIRALYLSFFLYLMSNIFTKRTNKLLSVEEILKKKKKIHQQAHMYIPPATVKIHHCSQALWNRRARTQLARYTCPLLATQGKGQSLPVTQEKMFSDASERLQRKPTTEFHLNNLSHVKEKLLSPQRRPLAAGRVDDTQTKAIFSRHSPPKTCLHTTKSR